jgi:hypothetical protein
MWDESFFEECLLNAPDKEEKSLDDGELWMNLHEDSLLREFGISLDALERYYFEEGSRCQQLSNDEP